MMRSFVEDLILNGRLGLGWRPLVRVTDENRHRRLPSPIVLVLVLVLQNAIERSEAFASGLCYVHYSDINILFGASLLERSFKAEEETRRLLYELRGRAVLSLSTSTAT